jgi:hypothetical protein
MKTEGGFSEEIMQKTRKQDKNSFMNGQQNS